MCSKSESVYLLVVILLLRNYQPRFKIIIVMEFVPVLSDHCINRVRIHINRCPQRAPHNFRYKTKVADWDLFGSLFVVHAKDFMRSSLSTKESADILSKTFHILY